MAVLLTGCATPGRSPAPSVVTPLADDSKSVSLGSVAVMGDEEAQQRASQHFSLGQSFSLEGNADRAIEEYKMALVYDPDSAVIHTRLATEYVKKGLLTFAIEECKNAVRLDPEYTDARLLLAGLYGATKMLPEALAQYEAILKSKKLTADARAEVYVFKGSLLLEEGRPQEALASLNQLIKDDPESHMGHYYLGAAHGKLGNVDRAVASYKKALQLKSDFALAAMALGQLYEGKGRVADAIKTYEGFLAEARDVQVAGRLAQLYIEKNQYAKAIKPLELIARLDPDNLNIRVKMGLIYVELKQFAKAEKIFVNLLAQYPQAERIRFYLGSVYEELKNVDRAIEVFAGLSEASDAYADASIHIAYLEKNRGNVSAAKDWVNKAIKKSPSHSGYFTFKVALIEEEKGIAAAIEELENAKDRFGNDEKFLYYYGALLDKNGQTDAAMEAMRRILEVNPENANALNYVGYTLSVQGKDLVQAEAMIRKALALKPEDPYIQDSLGYVLLKQGRNKDAVVALEKAARMKPDEGIIIEHLADAYLEMNLRSKALQKYVEASKLYGDPTSRSKVEQRINDLQGPTNRIPAEAR